MAFHIFTVTEETFNVHLKYKFVGTGSNPRNPEWKIKDDWDWLHKWVAEDIICCNEWDRIIFYVMNVWFFWFFKAVSDPFLDEEWKTYFSELWIRLPYRILFEIDEDFGLFLKPSPEWETTDDLSIFDNPKISDIQWNWLYKKLSGNRGCLHIFDWEWENIKKIIKTFNTKPIRSNPELWLTYNSILRCIETNSKLFTYKWSTSRSISIDYELFSSEFSLEFFILKNRQVDILWKDPSFIGAQTIASLWKRAIDILAISPKREWRIIELKRGHITAKLFSGTLTQIQKYIKWARSRYIWYIKDITPIIVFREWFKKENKNGEISKKYAQLLNDIRSFNENSGVSLIEIYEYSISDDDIIFTPFTYDNKPF